MINNVLTISLLIAIHLSKITNWKWLKLILYGELILIRKSCIRAHQVFLIYLQADVRVGLDNELPRCLDRILNKILVPCDLWTLKLVRLIPN